MLLFFRAVVNDYDNYKKRLLRRTELENYKVKHGKQMKAENYEMGH